jgi:hypothetical protein
MMNVGAFYDSLDVCRLFAVLCFFYTGVLQTVSVLQIVGGLTGGPSERFLTAEVLNGKFRLENIMKKLLKMSYEVDKIYFVKEELCLIVMYEYIEVWYISLQCQ